MVQISSVNISSHLVRFKDCANSTFPSFWSCSQNESSVNNYGSGRGLAVWEWKETLYYWNEQCCQAKRRLQRNVKGPLSSFSQQNGKQWMQRSPLRCLVTPNFSTGNATAQGRASCGDEQVCIWQEKKHRAS